MKTKEMIGQKFNRWTVLSKGTRKRYVICLCECGIEKSVLATDVWMGKSKSCGCLRTETIMSISTTHGQSDSPEYNTWQLIKSRIFNPENKKFEYYGGRGITMHPSWVNSFETFFAHVGKRPTPKHSIDRFPDVNGNYEPGNVRWATDEQQKRNRTDNRWVTHNGRTMVVKDWENELGLCENHLYKLMDRYDNDFEKVLDHLNKKNVLQNTN